MKLSKARCLILACGNTLREDDGVGPWLAQWAEERFRSEPAVRVLSSHQWTPEMAEEIAQAESLIFIDCATDIRAGSIQSKLIEAGEEVSGLTTHHLNAPQLLSLSKELYGSIPRSSLLLTVGAGSLELREGFSEPVQAALPGACKRLEQEI